MTREDRIRNSIREINIEINELKLELANIDKEFTVQEVRIARAKILNLKKKKKEYEYDLCSCVTDKCISKIGA